MVERSTTARISWRGPTPDDESILSAFVDSGAFKPSIDLDSRDEPGVVRVTFGYRSPGPQDRSLALSIATTAARRLGDLQQIDTEAD
jgi:hypothetical protein